MQSDTPIPCCPQKAEHSDRIYRLALTNFLVKNFFIWFYYHFSGIFPSALILQIDPRQRLGKCIVNRLPGFLFLLVQIPGHILF